MLRSLLCRAERGQFLLIGALMLPIVLGMTGMAIDLGTYASARRDMQNAADAIALAAAQDLPDPLAADAAANEWAAKHNIDPNRLSVSITGGNVDPRVTVEVERPHQFAFLRILGVTEKDVHARAVAAKVSYGGSSGVVPWTVTQDTVNAAGNGELVTLKYDADGNDIGNFGAIRIDGSGADVYEESAKFGSEYYVCAVSVPSCVPGACPGEYPEQCAEDAPACDGPECTPQTGNLIGPTRNAVDLRMNHTSAECDTFEEAFPTQDADGKYQINQACNPWTEGACPKPDDSPYALCSRRVIVIPVVDDFGSGGSEPATIQRFALLYLEGYDDGKCTGNSCEIKGRFVRADLTPNALAGHYDEEASVHFARLVE